MPELPDVEEFRQYFDATALHQSIGHVHVESPSILADTSPQGLGRALRHHEFESSRRHGKTLFVELDSGKWLVMHFGMTGGLRYYRDPAREPDYTRLRISFENGGHLAYVSRRKLGRVALSDGPGDWIEARGMGPDAWDLDEEDFIELASRHGGGIKAWLMNQRHLAGIGNVYSDEILYQARLHPKTPIAALAEKDLRRVYRAMREVLGEAVEADADPANMPAHFLLPHRRAGAECPRCGGEVKKMRAAGRGAWYCPKCQPLP